MAPLGRAAVGEGLVSFMICEIPAGTDKAGVVSALALVDTGAAIGGLQLN